MPSPVVTAYVDEAIAQLRRLDVMRSPGKVPDSMLDPSVPAHGDWVGWKPVPSTVTDEDLNALERETGLPFPPLYRDFLKYLHFVDLTEVGIRFERHMCHNWRETLRREYFRSSLRPRILGVGLIPFGDETQRDAGYACFDTRRRLPDGDCPVVFWDHEWLDTDKEIRPLFSSSSKMFRCLTLIAREDVNFLQREDNEDAAIAGEKRDLLVRFLSTDPEGAGGMARSYWCSFWPDLQ